MAECVAQCPFCGQLFDGLQLTDHCNYCINMEDLREEFRQELSQQLRRAGVEIEERKIDSTLNKIRAAVSQKKRRYQKDGFDLDLTYITNRIIAMGFPSHGTEGYYRNPAEEVERFFEFYHKGRYKVFNLCSERQYHDPKLFSGSWYCFPFDDHNPPVPISLIPAFCAAADEWLKANEANVIAVHCKAGKGRTGVMITCYLMYSTTELRKSADALHFFSQARTQDNQGVTIPSQQRYCWYWEQILLTHGGRIPAPKQMFLKWIVIKGPIRLQGGCEPYFIIYQEKKVLWDRKDVAKTVVYREGKWEYNLTDYNIALLGDIKFVFFDKKYLKDDHLFHCWVNTAFVPLHIQLNKMQLDKACKDGDHKVIDPLLQLDLFLDEAPTKR
eukprot:TRINITY_DN13596_c0_g1_i1.p1 TRINITY_DN13596_c0_g1~~TRINITY_DN13596_c0_g1_i1.p1  ORF type:complete len:392 (-),score=82.58 TRINITY_DN13596_c0_g1_i1:15-1169(-)